MQVSSIKKPKAPPQTIQLVYPKNKSEMTPGVVTFKWKTLKPLHSKKKKPFRIEVERIGARKKFQRETVFLEHKVDLRPGKYRWRVAANPSKAAADSRWRQITVHGYKSRRTSSAASGLSGEFGLGEKLEKEDASLPGKERLSPRAHDDATDSNTEGPLAVELGTSQGLED
jgi:hypothetical protein